MQALISPNEKVIDPNTGYLIGVRIAEVCENPFEVASPLFWVSCANNIVPNEFYYSTEYQQIVLIPELTQ
jgi:hypothetical protein